MKRQMTLDGFQRIHRYFEFYCVSLHVVPCMLSVKHRLILNWFTNYQLSNSTAESATLKRPFLRLNGLMYIDNYTTWLHTIYKENYNSF